MGEVLLSVLGLFFFCSFAFAAEGVEERRVVHLLIRDLADKKPAVRAEAERKLTRLGEAAVDDLALALDGKHVAVTTMPAGRRDTARARAARVLGAIGGKRPARHLTAVLGDKSALVRRAAIAALGDMRHKPAVPELVKLAADPDAAVAAEAVRSLGAIGDPAAVKPLLALLTSPDALKKKYKTDAGVSLVRGNAAFALGMMGDTVAAPELLRALRDADARVRRHADLALRVMSGRKVGFKADGPTEERERAATVWDTWWEAELAKE